MRCGFFEEANSLATEQKFIPHPVRNALQNFASNQPQYLAPMKEARIGLYKQAVYAILSCDGSVNIPQIFTKIEDFMWFKVCNAEKN